MNVITIESEAYQALLDKIDSLSQTMLEQHKAINFDEAWVDSGDICSILKISPRTLQRLRSKGEITYSFIGKKAYYTLSEVSRLLESRIVRSHIQTIDGLSKLYTDRLNGIRERKNNRGNPNQ
ncbi:helix-turn-helix domain-containing protein [Saccharicrinis aurantiacus]|uniref:helix-turn-helix domain-containing protein n=1 Tax=Saccharicrinis aurantiacus TaxID=1849719 RepID=UPI0009502F35|nr:helix-turn-helix domain-containing protein [Saccharicrinis aurantiacus]